MLDKKYRWLRNHIPEEIVFPRVENSINYPITKWSARKYEHNMYCAGYIYIYNTHTIHTQIHTYMHTQYQQLKKRDHEFERM